MTRSRWKRRRRPHRPLIAIVALLGCARLVGIDPTHDESGGAGGAAGVDPAAGRASGAVGGNGAGGESGSDANPPTAGASSGTAGAGGSSDAGSNGGGSDAGASEAGSAGVARPRGPTMIEATGASSRYFIDSTEVTVGHYDEFLSEMADRTDAQPAHCAWNTRFEPDAPGFGANVPVTEVDWCDARAFCEWAGKRLCGRIGDGPLEVGYVDLELSEFDHACGGPSHSRCPYGLDERIPGSIYPRCPLCNEASQGQRRPVDVASFSECEGGYPGLFDLVGNVAEWLDACEGTSGAADLCRLGGSSYVENVNCREGVSSPYRRDTTAPAFGFRCCRD